MSGSGGFHGLYRELRIADQRKFYENRRDEYRTAHRQAIMVRNLLLALAAVGGVVGQLVDGMPRAALAVGAAILAALATVITAFEELIGFSPGAKLYADAAVNLAEAGIDWDATGPDADLSPLVNRVEDILSREASQWGQLATEAHVRHDEPQGRAPESE